MKMEAIKATMAISGYEKWLTLDAFHIAMNNGSIKETDFVDSDRVVVFDEAGFNQLLKLESQIEEIEFEKQEVTRDWLCVSDMQRDYSEFYEFSYQIEDTLSPIYREWLGEWRLFDLINSPMDDKKRTILREGHFEGYLQKWIRDKIESK